MALRVKISARAASQVRRLAGRSSLVGVGTKYEGARNPSVRRLFLGADPRRLLGSIFSRALGQLAIGVAVGIAAAVLLDRLTEGGLMGGQGAIVLPVVAALMTAVGLLAAAGPARRGLRVQPTEALREQ